MENKTTKKIITSLFYAIIVIIAYGYLFSVALRLLNKPNSMCNTVGVFLIFMLCGVALLYATLRYKEYKDSEKQSDNKGDEVK